MSTPPVTGARSIDACLPPDDDRPPSTPASSSTVEPHPGGLPIEDAGIEEGDVAACMLPYMLTSSGSPSVLEKARTLVRQGDLKSAAALLESTATTLQREHRFDEATVLLDELGRPPLSSQPRGLMNERVQLEQRRSADFDPKRHYLVVNSGGNETNISARRFDGASETVADLRLRQIEVTRRMEASLGRPVELHDPQAARAYFERFAQTHSTREVAAEFGEYVRAAWAHSGGEAGVTWTGRIPMDERPRRLSDLFSAQPVDEAGRKIIDCEGFAYLADAVLRGLDGPGGSFEVSYASTQSHTIAVITTTESHELFVVNNTRVTEPSRPKSDLEAITAIADQVCRGRADVLRIGRSQSESEPGTEQNFSANVREGAVLWNGSQVVEVVDEELKRAHAVFVKQRWSTDLTFSAFVRWYENQ